MQFEKQTDQQYFPWSKNRQPDVAGKERLVENKPAPVPAVVAAEPYKPKAMAAPSQPGTEYWLP